MDATLYFAPLEGLTDAIYRRVHHALFGGLDKYFMPFISPSSHLSFTSRQQADISPRENAGVPAVPQVLANNADNFLEMAKLLRDAGYGEVNLNLGCPSGTVTGKGKGAAMLKNPDALARFLDQVYARAPLPVSLKTRVGFESLAEWPRLLQVFAQYPVHEWILHPRTRQEGYQGEPHWTCFQEAKAAVSFPVVYNGDLFTMEDISRFLSFFPSPDGLMLGRGLAVNPVLAREIKGGPPLTLEEVIRFHDQLYRAYLQAWPEHAVIGRMHNVMFYLAQAVDCPAPARRALRKASNPREYNDAVSSLFAQSVIRPQPRFVFP